jgi:hypothetical protein
VARRPRRGRRNRAKNGQTDKEARWTKKHGRSFYGYKNHVNADTTHKLIRRYDVSDAAVHDSQKLNGFPAPYRWMDDDKRFIKYQWVEVRVTKATQDSRPESHKLNVDPSYKAHTMSCTDWEMGQSYRSWRDEYEEEWETAFRQTYEEKMITRYDTHFFVGAIHRYPREWIIVGLFYPPHPVIRDLFD